MIYTCEKCLLNGFHGCSHTHLPKQERAKCAKAFSTMYQCIQEDFCDGLITHSETWVHHYDPETKVQSKRWKRYDSPALKKARTQPSKGKTLLTVFLESAQSSVGGFLG